MKKHECANCIKSLNYCQTFLCAYNILLSSTPSRALCRIQQLNALC